MPQSRRLGSPTKRSEHQPGHQSPYAETHDLQLRPMRASRLQNPYQHDEGPGVRCPNCNRQYCLKHRLREEHDCAKITPLGGRPAGAGANNANETLRSMFARVRTWGKDKSHAATQSLTPTPKPNSPAARAVQLNALKKSAKGDANVPADKRLYLHVVGTSDTQRVDPPKGDFYFDSRWKVGRVLDDAARRLRIENVNNRAEEKERLRIFHVESGEFLEFSDALGAGKLQSGHTIVLMRGAGVMLGK
ncbi:AN1 zinc finger protein [Aspergillus nomiae NRRL 13137]|uniref:AN1 zinc finger protein n=1 Tax=Aspergillus nomiae NRRL (strain ATCC 15546 / NRRL 13137 / CBS 260.88 / M93) TaxID=1509407 RepID=A0A0L1IPY6_ASPN3|nr:AN1 zinc finger protein [Aspergillus nomiae NRRL 13137]KNG81626.1 AN1 zinc finger protein [Aspergillus nomiae NRRL 13137]